MRSTAGNPGRTLACEAEKEHRGGRKAGIAARQCVTVESVSGPDPYDLQRFVDAQSAVFDTVIDELRDGRKRSHWIWFIFPQLAGLGSSPTAIRYAIASRAEAGAYLDHSILGPRLRECTRLVSSIDGASIEEIFGWPDYLKVRSSMTLFSRCTADNADFLAVLAKYYGGDEDPVTAARLDG